MLKYAGKKQLRSGVYLCLWSLSFSIAMLFTKKISAQTPQSLILFIRSCVGFFAMSALWIPFKPWKVLHSPHGRWLFLRGLLQSSAMWCTYASYRYLPGETAAFLGTSGPFFVLLCAHLFLKETLDKPHWILLALGYLGVLCVLNPFSVTFSAYSFLPILSNLALALSIILTRYLITVHEDTKRILCASSLFPFGVCTIIYLATGAPTAGLAENFWALVSVGIGGGSSAAFHFYALKYASSAFVAIFDYFRLIVFLILNYLVYAEPLNMRAWIGGIIIILTTASFITLRQTYTRFT